MRIRLLLFSCLLAFWPGVAQAQWDWYEWLQELSGPGPFEGIFAPVIDLRLACFPREPIDRNKAIYIKSPSCLLSRVPSDRRRRLSIGVQFARLSTDRTNLQYAAPALEPDKITLTMVGPSVWWRPVERVPSVEIGAAAGIVWFSGKPTGSFSTFARGVVEPLRVDIKPFAVINDLFRDHQTWTEFWSVQAGLVVIPKRFVAEEFGAVPGSFGNVMERRRRITLFFELDPILRHRRGAL